MNLVKLLFFSWLSLSSAYADDSVAVGVTLFEENNIVAAHQFFTTFVQEQPTNGVGAFYLGRTFFAQEQYEQAIEWLDKAVLLDGQNADYHLWLDVRAATRRNGQVYSGNSLSHNVCGNILSERWSSILSISMPVRIWQSIT